MENIVVLILKKDKGLNCSVCGDLDYIIDYEAANQHVIIAHSNDKTKILKEEDFESNLELSSTIVNVEEEKSELTNNDIREKINLSEETIIQYILGKTNLKDKIFNVVSEKEKIKIEEARLFFLENIFPDEVDLNNSFILNISIRNAQKYDWDNIDTYSIGDKQRKIFGAFLLKKAISYLSKNDLFEAENIAKEILNKFEEEQYRDEALNIIAYIKHLNADNNLAAKTISKALDGEYNSGLVHNGFLIAAKLPEQESQKYISELFSKTYDTKTKIDALNNLANAFFKNNLEVNENTNFDILLPQHIIDEVKKILFNDKLTVEQTITLLNVLHNSGDETIKNDKTKINSIYQHTSLEVEFIIIKNEESWSELFDFIKNKKQYIKENEKLKARISRMVSEFLRETISLNEESDITYSKAVSILTANLADACYTIIPDTIYTKSVILGVYKFFFFSDNDVIFNTDLYKQLEQAYKVSSSVKDELEEVYGLLDELYYEVMETSLARWSQVFSEILETMRANTRLNYEGKKMFREALVLGKLLNRNCRNNLILNYSNKVISVMERMSR